MWGSRGGLGHALTLPDSPAPSKSIFISFLAIMRSFLSWLSISSFPTVAQGEIECKEMEKKETDWLWPRYRRRRTERNPFRKSVTELCELLSKKQKSGRPRRGGRRWNWGALGRRWEAAGRAAGWWRGEGGREGDGTVGKKGENPFEGGGGGLGISTVTSLVQKRTLQNEYKQTANNHFRIGKPRDKVRP